MSVKHSTTAIGTDSTDGLIGKSAWNADHVETHHGAYLRLTTNYPSPNSLDQVDFDSVAYDTDGYASVGKATGSWGLTGTVSLTSGSTTVVGTGTAFSSELAPGNIIGEDGFRAIGTVRSITSNTSLELWQPQMQTVSGSLIRFTGYTVPVGLGGYYDLWASVSWMSKNATNYYGGQRFVWIWRPIRRAAGMALYDLLGGVVLGADTSGYSADQMSVSGVFYANELDIVLVDGGAVWTSNGQPSLIGGNDATTYSALMKR